MSHYKITLQLNEQELTLLHNALSDYIDNSSEEIKEDAQSLFDKVSDLYIEENISYQMSGAAKAFIDQFGVEEMFQNPSKWETFKEVYNAKVNE